MNHFKSAILDELKMRAFTDSTLAEALVNPKKNIDDCAKYVINTVKKSGGQGFTSDEVYSMAIHYFMEDDIDVGGDTNVKIVIDKEVKLTPEEIEKLKEKARKEVIDEEKAKMRKKPVKAKQATEKKPEEPNTLF